VSQRVPVSVPSVLLERAERRIAHGRLEHQFVNAQLLVKTLHNTVTVPSNSIHLLSAAVGALTLARAVEDPRLSDEILESVHDSLAAL
jgi:hypothetical protein